MQNVYNVPLYPKLTTAISGLAFGSFLSLHFVNTMSASFGPLGYEEVQTYLRQYYQHPLVEPLLFGSLGVHVCSGAYLWYKRRDLVKANRINPHYSLRHKIHSYAGYCFVLF